MENTQSRNPNITNSTSSDMENTHSVFDAKVTTRGTLHTLTSIKELLGQSVNEKRRTRFLSTVFGKWLDFPAYSNDNLLMNYIFQHEVKQEQNNDVCPPIRVFPDKIAEPLKKVRVSDLLELIRKPKIWSALSDEDSVKWEKDPFVIPRGLACSKIGNFEKGDYGALFAEWSNPIVCMAPTSTVLLQPWLIRSMDYFRTLLVDGQPNGPITASPEGIQPIICVAVVHDPQFEQQPKEVVELVPLFTSEELVVEYHSITTTVQLIENVGAPRLKALNLKALRFLWLGGLQSRCIVAKVRLGDRSYRMQQAHIPAVDKCHGHILRYGFLPGYKNWSVHGENSVPSQPSRPTFVHETSFGKDEIRSLVRDALGQIPSDSRVVCDSMFEDNVGESSQSSHRRVEDENVGIRSLVRDALGQIPSDSRVVGDSMFEDNVGESSQSSHRRVEDENVGESSKSSDDSATYKKLLEEYDKELYPGCKYSNLSFTLHLYHVKCIGGVSNKTFGMFLELIRDVFPHLTSLPSSVSEAKKLTKDLGLGYKKIDACLNDCMLYWDTRKDQKYCHVCKASRYKSDTADDIDGLAWKGFDARYSDFASDPRSVKLDQFNGTCKEEGPPTPLTGSDILEQLSGASFICGKSDDSSNKSNKRTRDGVGCSTNAHDEANAESSVFEDIESFVEEETGQHLL
ncbi:hypothetical protein Tco_0918237 [Tanacetum coccineum]